MSGKIELLLAFKRSLKLDTFEASAMYGAVYSTVRPIVQHNHFPLAKMKTWLTDLEVVPSEVTCNWRFKELLRRRVQVTMEQLVHRDKSSREKVSLHRGQFEFVEAYWTRWPSESLHISRR